MAVVKMQAQKMSNANVQFISLVKRGANRIPFKVVKQEKEMSRAFSGLDLGSFFAKKSEKVEPTIVGIAVAKGEGFESIKKQIAEAGFAVEDATELEDGSVVFKQAEAAGEETVIRMNDHIVLITKGFSPYNMDFEGEASFAEMAAARGFYPGINSIMGTLTDMVDNTVRKSASPSDAQKMVTKVFQEAGSYINSFLSGLPTKAFKLEGVAPEVVSKEGESAPAETLGETTADTGATTDAAGTDTNAETVAKGETEVPAGTEEQSPGETVEKTGEKSLTVEDVTAIVQSTVSEQTTGLAKKMDGLVETLTNLANSFNGLSDTVGTFSARVEAAEQVAKAAQEAVTGTVVTEEGGVDGAPVQKREREYRGGEIDTAYHPRRQQANRR